MTENKKRRKRFERKTNLGRIRIMPRDREVIEAIYHYRVLNTDQIKRLFFEGTDRRVAERRLAKLYDHEYLERRRPINPDVTNPLASPILYLLGKNGSQFLLSKCGYDEVRWSTKSNSVGYEHLRHLQAINEFRIAVELACRNSDEELVTWIDDTTLKQDYDRVYIDSERKRVSVIPDGYFKIKVGDSFVHFFLELDRGNMASKRYQRKVKAYLAYHRFSKERFGTTKYRVLTVTEGLRRYENLKQATEDVGGKSRFWFGSLEDMTPETVLHASVWSVAGRDKTYSLI